MPTFVTYVGDPFVDTGIAVLEHRLDKPCEEFSEDDLLSQGADLIQLYSQKIWSGVLMLHFMNSGWTNRNMGADKIAKYKEKVLRGFRRAADAERVCEYCRRPANAVVDGSTIPLLSGAKSMDCGPGGRLGFAVCGYCLFAIQFYPLATLKVGPKALLWWSSDRQWTYLLSDIALREVHRFLSASPDGSIKPKFPWSRLLAVARQAFEEWHAQPERIPLCDIIGCHVTNYRTSPEFDELRIPRELFEFWDQAASGFGTIYESIVSTAWQVKVEKITKGKKPKHEGGSEWERKNGLYEALGAAFRTDDFRPGAVDVAKKYFIRVTKTAAHSGRFELACLFLERLAGMRKNRIDAIKEIGDSIARSSEKRKLLPRLFNTRNIFDALVYIQRRIGEKNETPLCFDTIITALDLVSEDDSLPQDFWLVRSLIQLRVMEQVDIDTLRELPDDDLEASAADDKKE